MQRSSLNEALLAAALALPQGRGYRFDPVARAVDDPTNPRDPRHDGVTHDLMHRDVCIATAAADGATYCCGVSFEAWFRASGSPARDLAPATLTALLGEWFCPTMGHAGVAEALTRRGLGARVSLDEARPGDLCQFWRSVDLARPSGHSVVVLGQADGRLSYWSSQRATDGVGVHSEEIGPAWQIHVVRPFAA